MKKGIKQNVNNLWGYKSPRRSIKNYLTIKKLNYVQQKTTTTNDTQGK